MKHSAPRGRQLKRLACLSTATVAVEPPGRTVGRCGTGARWLGDPPGVDEIASSANLKQVANLPKQAPFNTETAFNTDWAFQGKYAFGGNYNGFTVYDISKPRHAEDRDARCSARARRTTSRSTASCSSSAPTRSAPTTRAPAPPRRPRRPPADRWEGIKIFDISNPLSPQYIEAVKTDCGSHTQTLVPGKGRDRSVYLYVSSYNLAGSEPAELRSAARQDLDRQGAAARHPTAAAVVATPVLFPDGGTRRTGSNSLRRPAATTSPRTRPRTSRPAPAWVTARCSTSRTARRRRSSPPSGTP